ncbi:oligosaccharide repeat unit polymerase family protein [Methanobrevibacter filiformis]|uniref:oligosaccharide repeat unit polymerase family protein n=1 Tax=Methanobrevibacter filiformis TaxID=55758 RepID=UPI001FE12B09|nr:oligosaccharide repeat unit polymerase family protein [Methanobrevibacter filiformis]
MNSISFSLEINLAIAFISFFIGSNFIPRFFFKNNKSIVKFNYDDIYSIGFCLFLVAVIFFFLCIASVGGIPMLNPSLRYSLKPILTMPVFLIVPAVALILSSYLNDYKTNKITLSMFRFRYLVLIIISLGLLIFLGYRSPIISILLIMIIIGHYGKILASWEIIIGIFLGLIMITGIGYFRSIGEFMITHNTNPIYSLQTRADFTLHVLNLLNYISGDFGLLHGSLTASAIPGSEFGPRSIIGQLLAWRTKVTLTPTLIGPMLIDFGRVGVGLGMGLLGFILGIGHKIVKLTKDSFYIGLYALLLTYTILGIETGIVDIQVLSYFILGLFIYIIIILKNSLWSNNVC